MSSPLTSAGALTDPSNAAALHTNRAMTGLWTNRNELRDAAVTALYEKFYSASRYDSMVGGLNCEVTRRMTFGRRPGSSVYNNQNFPPIKRFYGFRTFSTNDEQIHVMADTAGAVYDATGPSRKLNIWNKLPGATDSTFLGVGNNLYWGDGVSQNRWSQSLTSWTPATAIPTGTVIVDSNNNQQVAYGGITVGIVNIQIGGNLLTITLDPDDPRLPDNLAWLVGLNITLNGLTNATFLNGQSLGIVDVPIGSPATASNVVRSVLIHADYASTPDTGTITSGTGITGAVQPVWATASGAWTYFDGGQQWLCRGSSVGPWGIETPANAPKVFQNPIPNTFPVWIANTFYSTSLAVHDPNTNIQLLTTAGVTGAVQPVWNTVLGGTTADGTAVWTLVNIGDARLPGTAYALGALVEGDNASIAYFFKAVGAGVSGGGTPSWPAAFGAQVQDGAVVWQNMGPITIWQPPFGPPFTAIGPNVNVVLEQTILDNGGFLQDISYSGLSGATEPTWDDSGLGAITTDNAALWTNGGAYAAPATDSVTYAYAFKDSTENHTGTSGPRSLPFFLATLSDALVQGQGSDNPHNDTIVIYRTAQGGSTLLYLDEIPAPAGGSAATWSYIDKLPDSALNELLPAAVASSNNPPPSGFRPLAYHLNRTFGAVGNVLSWSNGTNQTGDPTQSFTPSNNFVYPAKIVTAWACTLGLLVFTVSEPYIVLGSGTDADPLYTKKYMDGLGILSYDAFCVNKTTPFLMDTVKKVMALDPSSGVIEPGFPIADQFETLFDANTVKMTWHEGTKGDTALYVGDGIDSFFRMAALSAPESGMVWSSKATIAGGYSAMGSVETTPGQKLLLFGPKVNGPILFRDPSKNTDNGAKYPWYPIIGSIVLAQPGQLAQVSFMTLESVKSGTRPTIGVLLGEIGGGNGLHFETLKRTRQDPPLLPPARTLYNDRFAMMQRQKPVLCRHMQIRFDWPAEDAYNELLTYTIFGALNNEMKSQ